MKRIVLSFKFYKSFLKLNLLTIIQLIVTMLVFINLISLKELYTYSSKALSEFPIDTSYYFMPHSLISFDFETDAELPVFNYEELIKAKNIINVSEADFINEMGDIGRIISYSENAFNYYSLPLVKNRFFSKDKETDYIEAILVDCNSSLKIGDEFIIKTFCKKGIDSSNEEKELRVKIINKIKNPPQLLDLSTSGDVSFANLVKDYRHSVLGVSSIIISERDFKKQKFENLGSNNSIIVFHEGMNKKDIEFNYNQLSNYGKVLSFSDINNNQKIEYELSIKKNISFFILVSIIAVISLISTAIISTEHSIGKLQILFLNGAQWMECASIMAFNILTNIVFAGIPTSIILLLSMKFNFSIFQAFYISESAIGLAWLLYLMCFLMSIVPPLFILVKNKPERIILYINRS